MGSLNGGEISHKINREVVLLTDQPDVYNRLLDVFLYDWSLVIRWQKYRLYHSGEPALLPAR